MGCPWFHLFELFIFILAAFSIDSNMHSVLIHKHSFKNYNICTFVH